jgi:hypothetical protein
MSAAYERAIFFGYMPLLVGSGRSFRSVPVVCANINEAYNARVWSTRKCQLVWFRQAGRRAHPM